jgi:UDP-glucuronate 4-epimerase
MKITVTGAAGFIGSHLCEALSSQGHVVTGVDNFSDYYSPALKRRNVAAVRSCGVTCIERDLVSDALEDLVACDVLYHLAAQPGISELPFQSYVSNNLTATLRLLDAIRATRSSPGVVYVSTSSVYGRAAVGDEGSEPKPTSLYGVTKLAAEQATLAAAREGGLAACSLRLFSVYGPRERPDKLFATLLRSVLEDRPFTLREGSESHRRSFTYVGDAVNGLLSVLPDIRTHRGEIFNIGATESASIGDALALVERITERSVRVVRTERRPGDQEETRARIDKARTVLGYEPKTTLEAGVTEQFRWLQSIVDSSA